MCFTLFQLDLCVALRAAGCLSDAKKNLGWHAEFLRVVHVGLMRISWPFRKVSLVGAWVGELGELGELGACNWAVCDLGRALDWV